MSDTTVYTTCWPCLNDNHFKPPQWHRWADIDDAAAAEKRGAPLPFDERCACPCADAERFVSEVAS